VVEAASVRHGGSWKPKSRGRVFAFRCCDPPEFLRALYSEPDASARADEAAVEPRTDAGMT